MTPGGDKVTTLESADSTVEMSIRFKTIMKENATNLNSRTIIGVVHHFQETVSVQRLS